LLILILMLTYGNRRREAVKAIAGDTTLHEEEGVEEEEDGEGLEDVEAGHGGGGRPAEQKVRGEEKKAPTGILKKKRVGGKRHNLRQPSDWATYLEDAFPHDRRGGRGARGKGRRADGEGFLTPVRPAKGALNDYYDEHEEHDHDDDDEDEEEGGGEEDEEEEDDEYLFSPEEAAFEGAGAEGAQQTADTWGESRVLFDYLTWNFPHLHRFGQQRSVILTSRQSRGQRSLQPALTLAPVSHALRHSVPGPVLDRGHAVLHVSGDGRPAALRSSSRLLGPRCADL
jgi:hypothetical protein